MGKPVPIPPPPSVSVRLQPITSAREMREKTQEAAKRELEFSVQKIIREIEDANKDGVQNIFTRSIKILTW